MNNFFYIILLTIQRSPSRSIWPNSHIRQEMSLPLATPSGLILVEDKRWRFRRRDAEKNPSPREKDIYHPRDRNYLSRNYFNVLHKRKGHYLPRSREIETQRGEQSTLCKFTDITRSTCPNTGSSLAAPAPNILLVESESDSINNFWLLVECSRQIY